MSTCQKNTAPPAAMESDQERRDRIKTERRARKAAREESKRKKKERRRQQIAASGQSAADLRRLAPSGPKPGRRPRQQEGAPCPLAAEDEAYVSTPYAIPSAENTIRLAVVGCGGWFCNRAHLPALAKIIARKVKASAKDACSGNSQDFEVRITVLCGKVDGARKALSTLRRNGINLQCKGVEYERTELEEENDCHAVARFETLEEYLSFEEKVVKSNQSTLSSNHRSQLLADVCLLCVPIPKMVEAVGMCLRAGKCVISEKPASPNPRQSQSLWEACRHLRAGDRWLVSENWAHKASLASMKSHLNAEIVRQHGRPTSYSLSLCQGLDDTGGWRSNATQLYAGGALRDIGVHVIRALRRLFGEVETVRGCKYTCNGNETKGVSLSGTAHHGNYICGEIAMECKGDIDQEEQKAVISVFFGGTTTCCLVWDTAKSTIERHENDNVQLLERINGDSWIHGGVKESLEEGLDVFAGAVLGAPRSSRAIAPRSCPEEALRDVAVVDAMLECGRPTSSASVSVEHFRPAGALLQTSSAFIHNTMNTAEYQPTAIARCSSSSDVVAATKLASCSGIAFHPVGCCNSSNALQSESIWIDISLMNRILRFQADKNGQAATVRVEAGMQLSELCTALKHSGFTLPSLPILLDQTVGGAIATGSHGSSGSHGTLSDQVVSTKMVLLSGEVVIVIEDGAKIKPPDDGSKVIYNSSLLAAARCGVGKVGTTLDVTLQLIPTPTLQKREVELDMSSNGIADKIRTLVSSTEHCWIHWKLPNGNSEDSVAVAVVLEERDDSSAQPSSICKPYSARSWYPDGAHMKSLWQQSRKSRVTEKKNTAQWSLPLSHLEILIQRMSGLGKQLDSRVVELKFLQASCKTYLAPNSVKKDSSVEQKKVVALNVWIDSSDDSLLRLLERTLFDIPLTRSHLGKWHTLPVSDVLTSDFDEAICCARPLAKSAVAPPPTLSVILPIYNAMPWVPLAVRDCLKQGLDEGEITEVLCGDDCSTDGTLSFLVDLAFFLGDRGSVEVFDQNSRTARVLSTKMAREIVERRAKICPGEKKSTNPALSAPPRKAELSRQASEVVPDSEVDILERPLSAEEVAAATHANARLRVIVPLEDVNAGQGEVMTRCLRLCRGQHIGHMESDDERPDTAFLTMMNALRDHPEWDGVTSQTKCIGWEAEGMERYVAWQNSLTTPELMQRARFLEIPSMHQAGIFRLEAVLKSIGGAQGCFRDDEIWPVDTHFWLSFFDEGLVCGKVRQVLFHWRQHPGQQTRSHGRLSIENLRRCKCHFLCKEGGWIWKGVNGGDSVHLEVWTSGGSETLGGWVEELKDELRRHDKTFQCSVVGVEWRPGESIPGRHSSFSTNAKRVRLFAFGMEKARRKVREQIGTDWNDDVDIFVS